MVTLKQILENIIKYKAIEKNDPVYIIEREIEYYKKE
jgi:hypothetical protein